MPSSSEQHNIQPTQPPLPRVTLQDLERMSDEEFWIYARQRERMRPEQPAYTEYIECKFSTHACLIAFRDLAEVLPPPHRLARLPHMPIWMAGIMAWRGETIAVINLDLYVLGVTQSSTSWAEDSMLLVASQDEITMGLLVPALGATSAIAQEQITPPHASHHFAFTLDSTLVTGVYADVPILTISALLPLLEQQIGMAEYHE